jgi:hypothetical protein
MHGPYNIKNIWELLIFSLFSFKNVSRISKIVLNAFK